MHNSTAAAAPKNIALLVATMGYVLTPFLSAAVTVALPSIGQEYALSPAFLSWIATAYLVTLAALLLPAGRMADLYGRRRVFLYGVVTFSLSCLLGAAAPSAEILLVLRIVQGVGAAMILGTGAAILVSVFPADQRGKALGVNVAGVYFGSTLGPVVGGVLTQYFGWRSVFLITAPWGLLVAALVLWKLKQDWVAARGEKFDVPGSLTSGFGLVLLILGLSRLPDLSGAFFILLSLIALALFVVWERRVADPLLDVRLFRRNRLFSLNNLATLLFNSATFNLGFELSIYLQQLLGLSPQDAGLVLLFQPVVMMLISPVAGMVSDRLPARVLTSSGMALTTIGLALLSIVGRETTIAFVAGNLVLIGVGFALFSSPNTNAIISSVAVKSYGIASATIGAMRFTGQVMSMAVVMLTLSAVGGAELNGADSDLFLQAMRGALLISAGLCAAGVVVSIAAREARPRAAIV